MQREDAHDGKTAVDIDGLDYHCRMIEVYLNDIKQGKDFLADVRHHVNAMQDIFDDPGLGRVA